MGKLSKEEQAQLDELTARRDAPDTEPDDDEHDDGVILLRGNRADTFLDSLLGTGKRKRKPKPDDEDQGDEDQGDEPDPDPNPKPAHRFFR